jgi:hypothetical protein
LLKKNDPNFTVHSRIDAPFYLSLRLLNAMTERLPARSTEKCPNQRIPKIIGGRSSRRGWNTQIKVKKSRARLFGAGAPPSPGANVQIAVGLIQSKQTHFRNRSFWCVKYRFPGAARIHAEPIPSTLRTYATKVKQAVNSSRLRLEWLV